MSEPRDAVTPEPRDAAIAALKEAIAFAERLDRMADDNEKRLVEVSQSLFRDMFLTPLTRAAHAVAALTPTATPAPLDVALIRKVTDGWYGGGVSGDDWDRMMAMLREYAALREPRSEGVYVTAEEWDARCRCGDLTVCEIVEARRP